ncbi:MAG: hypothetical protein PHV37_08750 [Candidatus Gastranaerophilales bacterium]|nr:hypothetical protein [Candidatus Gastranaerophilales bacterium]
MNFQTDKSKKFIIYGGTACAIMDTLVVGPTILAYALILGASPILLGFISAIPYLGNLMHLLAAYLIEKGKSVKQISVISAFASRPFYLFIALIALLPKNKYSLFLLILFLLCAYLIGAISGGAWLPWMKMLINKNELGTFFSIRFKYMMIAKTIVFILVYLFLTAVKHYYPDFGMYIYSVLFLLAFIVGIYGAYTLTQVEDTHIIADKDNMFFTKFKKLFTEKSIKTVLSKLGYLNFVVNFATPFIGIYLLQSLKIGLNNVILLTLINQLSYISIINIVGKHEDEKGSDCLVRKAMLTLILSLVLIITTIYIPTTNIVKISLFLFIAHILIGLFTAVTNLVNNNIPLRELPDKMSSIYLASATIAKAIMTAIGSISAGFIFAICTKIPNVQVHWTLFFLISIFISLLCFIMYKKTPNAKSNNF